MGAKVEIIARNAAKPEATCAELREQTGNPKVGFPVADTGDLPAQERDRLWSRAVEKSGLVL